MDKPRRVGEGGAVLRRPRSYLALLVLALCAASLAVVPAAVAVDNGTIAFQGFRRGSDAERSVFTMAADGGNVKRVGAGEQPAISADGKKIAFVGAAGANRQYREVFVMDSDGTNVRQLTDDKSFDSQPSFSPDGKEVLYVGSRDKGQASEGSQIFVVTISGSDPQQLTHGGPQGQPFSNSEPSSAPNGNRIVFIGFGEGGAEIETMKTDGTDRTVLGKNAPFRNPSHPSYSPDGRRMVFQANAESGIGTNVYTFDPTRGTDLDKVNRGDTEAFEPAYSPNARSIVFRRGVNLFSMTTDGSGVEQLTDIERQDGSNSFPSWGR
jgi:Tol biopolymer transport system component